jgi:Xaa-Pro aminopeptidase
MSTAVPPSDAAFEALLRASGVDRPLAEVEALIAGIAAAPPRADPGPALDLVAPDAPAALRDALLQRIQGRRAAGGRPSGRRESAARLALLRAELERRGLAGFLVPMADQYQNEFVPERALRIAWLSGFTGSAGLIVALAEKAAIFVDGRYTLQVREQVDLALFEAHHLTDSPPGDWIARNLPEGTRLGYDPWLLTPDQAARFRAAAEKAGGSLVAVEGNLIDAVWQGQPPPPLAPVVPHPLEFAGEAASEKRRRIGAELNDAGADAAVITAPDSIAWLLNVRGGDVPRTPLPLSFLTLRADGQADLFIDRRKLSRGLEAHLGNEVRVRREDELADGLAELAGRKVRVDPALTTSWVFERLQAAGAEVVRGADPCQLAKACKNAVELDGARAAHVRDGAAVVRFLAWLAEAAPAGGVDEVLALERLARFRRRNKHFQDLSFDTISGAGPNGAIVHYRATPESNRRLEPGMLYLVDSGAQYLDGTTDITRTVAIGRPAEEMRDRFTRVLKGHIQLALCRFPEGTTGSQLDVLARLSLWQAGLDFDHGTGHGVGSYLGVHEGPQRISKIANSTALRPGMVVSNEPGYYKAGAYGIRIENLVTVVPVDGIGGAERRMLGFETLTRAPIDRALIVPDLLTAAERAWLDAYHAQVFAAISPGLEPEAAAWLAEATAPL